MGALVLLTVRPVAVTITRHESGQLPRWLLDALPHAPRVMWREIDKRSPVVIYALEERRVWVGSQTREPENQ